MHALDERAGAGLTRAAFEAEVLPRHRPLVLRGLVAHWPGVRVAAQGDEALTDWLRAHASPAEVDAVMIPPDQGRRLGYRDGVGPGFNFLRNRLPLGELLAQLARYRQLPHAPAVAAQSALLSVCAPGLVGSHTLDLVDPAQAPARLWLGNAITTPAHLDESHNLAAVVAGRRRFRLYPPGAVRHLRVGPLGQGPAGTPITLVDPDAPGAANVPGQREAHALALEAELAPGDAIYIPPLWWHEVASRGPLNLLINAWWQPSTAPAGATGLDALLHTLLALQQRPAAERLAWRTLFEHWVFEAQPGTFAHLPPGLRGLHDGATPEQAAAVRALLRERLGPG
jgi:hypothetical protein